ncbi:MAG TPA: DNA primase [Syntrophorhabdaceae bacterium]|nr:DNA primase [Syntrophorhabdaceae bacterium]
MKTTLDELLQRVNILDVVSQYVKLRKAGKDYSGICPFHKEKVPSFTVSVEKQMFYCFSCREGGNVINFLMRYENLSFQEAQEHLARQYGLELARKDGGKRAGHFDALLKLAEYYAENLRHSRLAIHYLHERGISNETIDEFRLGFSDKTSSNLRSFLKQSGIPNDLFLSTGIVRMKDGMLYEMFRGRVIIPIVDVNKKIIGFGGRTIEKEGFPKYINSPESVVFSKRTSLFGIDKTRKYISQSNEVYIVEGYFDFISLYANGLRNIVSTLGTAVTEGQLSRLRNYTENITLMLDGDEAGIKSALKLIELFAEMGLNGNMVVLPDGHDPDSFVRKNGIEALIDLASGKKPILDYYFDYYLNKHSIRTAEGKSSLIRAVLPHVQAIRDVVTRRLYIKRISELTGVEERHFAGSNVGTTGKAPDTSPKESIIEKKVICACVTYPGLLKSYEDKEVLKYVKNEQLKDIISRILNHARQSDRFDVHAFVESLDTEDLKHLVLESVFDSVELIDGEAEKVFEDYIKYTEKQFYREESRKITDKLSDAEKKGDEPEVLRLMEQKRQVLAYMKNNFL